jgi:protein XagA
MPAVAVRGRARAALLAALALAVSGQAWAGAWVQDDCTTLAILKYSHADGSARFDDERDRGDFGDHGRSRQDQLNLYLEYGLSARVSLIGNFYFSDFGYRNDYGSASTSGFGDQEIGLRWRLDPGAGDWHGALQALVSIPAYDRDDQPALGLGDYAGELRYSLGRGYRMGAQDGYLDMGLALRLRGADAADEVRFDISSGVALAPRWLGIAELNLIKGLGNGRGSNPVNFIESTNYDLAKLQLSALYSTAGRSQFQFGYQQPVAGRNTGAAGGPFVAAWWRF